MNDDLDLLFGGAGQPQPRPSFTERVGKGTAPRSVVTDDGVEVAGYRPYRYMPTGNVGQSCEVVTWLPGTETPDGAVFQYRFLMLVRFTGNETLRLMLPDAIVVIEGRHLGELRQKLDRHLITHIQEFNPRLWPFPAEGEPVIEKIEIVRPETARG